jgi:polysaccharide export outer membrane protein
MLHVSSLVLYISLLSCACSTNKKITYFKDIPDTVFLEARNIQTTSFQELQIQPNDILQVSILTLDPQINSVLSAANTASYTIQPGNSGNPAGTTPIAGYLVDKNGMI